MGSISQVDNSYDNIRFTRPAISFSYYSFFCYICNVEFTETNCIIMIALSY